MNGHNHLTTAQAAEILGIRPNTLTQHAARGHIAVAMRLGRMLIFARRDVAAFAKHRRPVGNPAFLRQKQRIAGK